MPQVPSYVCTCWARAQPSVETPPVPLEQAPACPCPCSVPARGLPCLRVLPACPSPAPPNQQTQAGVTALRTTELVQGRTSRWAIAWSWAACPSTASLPLRPRQQQLQDGDDEPTKHQQQPQQQQQGTKRQQQQQRASAAAAPPPPPRAHAFLVKAPPTDGCTLLTALAALLGSVGGLQAVALDAAKWQLTATLPPQQRGPHQPTNPPCLKQPRLSSGLGQDLAASPPDRMQVSVFQQRGNKPGFRVVAELQQQCDGAGDSSSTTLSAALAAVRTDLELMWPVEQAEAP